MSFTYKYPRPSLTADCIVIGVDDEALSVLLIERKNPPFQGCWAFPGGFMEEGETIETCAARELEEETGLKDVPLYQFHTFSTVDRDPRGRTVSVAFYGFVKRNQCHPVGGDDARRAVWFPLCEIPSLAFDHEKMLRMLDDVIGRTDVIANIILPQLGLTPEAWAACRERSKMRFAGTL